MKLRGQNAKMLGGWVPGTGVVVEIVASESSDRPDGDTDEGPTDEGSDVERSSLERPAETRL